MMNIEKHNFDEECNIDQLEPLATLGDFYSCTDIDPLLSELETMRTENANLKLHKEYDQTLDQLIIERDRILLENESLDDKLQEQLCTVGSLLEENAKLIAERDELIHDRDMLKMCADHYEDELKRMHAERDEGQKILDCKFGDNIVWFLREFENAEKEYLEEGYLEIYGEDYNGREGSCEITVNEICGEAANVIENLLAEREAMMKQEPVYQYHNSGNSWCDCNKNVYDAMKDEYRRIVYISPPPAQQIPEGYVPVPFEPTPEMVASGVSFAISASVSGCGGWPDYIRDLYKFMLSASQPKGESIERPANCRNRLHDEGKAYPRSGCYHCETGGLTGCPFDKPKGDM